MIKYLENGLVRHAYVSECFPYGTMIILFYLVLCDYQLQYHGCF